MSSRRSDTKTKKRVQDELERLRKKQGPPTPAEQRAWERSLKNPTEDPVKWFEEAQRTLRAGRNGEKSKRLPEGLSEAKKIIREQIQPKLNRPVEELTATQLANSLLVYGFKDDKGKAKKNWVKKWFKELTTLS